MLYAFLFGIVLPIVVSILFGRAGVVLTGHKGAISTPGLIFGLVIGLWLSRITATPVFQRMKGQQSADSDTFYGTLGLVILTVSIIATVIFFLLKA